jgi:hypothetical protein
MTENGLTKYESTEPSAPLPGWSAGTLFVRGTIIELCGFAMKAPLVVAAAGHHDVWTGGFYGIGIVAVLTGVADVPHFSGSIWPPTCGGQCFVDRGGSGGAL